MIVCSFPLTVLAAGESRTNIDLRFGDVSNTATPKTYTYKNATSLTNFDKFTGLNSTALDYDKNTGKINGYGIGDYFTVTVLMRNVTELAAAEVAINYSKSITPAYIQNIKRPNSTLPAEYTSTQAQLDEFPKLEAVPAQSGNAIHNNGTFTVGETSYIDAENNVMYANFAVQTGAPAVDTTSVTVGKETFTNTAVLATFMFKIVSDDPITFNIATDAADKYKTYYLNSAANGGKVSEYELYDQVDAESPALDFLGENEYNEPSVKTYTITFVDENGEKIQEYTYDENAPIIETPAFPASTKIDGTNHTAYKWDKDVPATATANVTIKRVKFNEAHNWSDWNQTKAPTTTEPGLKERECSVCHAKETADIPKLPEAHVHKWSEWKYNNDAVYDRNPNKAKDGTATRTCTDPNCPTHATEKKQVEGSKYLGFYGKTVTLSAAVTLNLVFDNTANTKFDQVYAEVLYNGKPYKLDEVTPYSGNLVKFDFEKIGPKNFDSPLEIKLCGVTSDGIVCKSDVLNYSIKTYLYNQLAKNPKPNLKKLLIETLYYGEADKVYNKMSATLTNELSAQQKAIHTTEVPAYVKQNEIIANPNPTQMDITWYGMSLALSGAVYVSFYLTVPAGKSISDYNFKFNIDGKEEVYNYKTHKECFTSQGNNNWCLDYQGVGSHQYGKPVTAIAYDAATGVQASPTRIYSVESYTYSGAYGRSSSLKVLVDQILRYGRANIAYRANPNA